MNENRRLVTKTDTAVLAVLTAVALGVLLLFHFLPKEASYAVISVDGREYMQVSLNKGEHRELSLENGVKILIDDGKIGFSDSDCPDRVCVHTGMLSSAGEVAACVPNRTVITVSGTAGASVDTITY